MTTPFWEKGKAEKSYLEARDPEGWWDVDIRRDGCVHLRRYHNIPIQEQTEAGQDDWNNSDYIHICDVDDLIERLKVAKAMALEHFGPAWPDRAPANWAEIIDNAKY